MGHVSLPLCNEMQISILTKDKIFEAASKIGHSGRYVLAVVQSYPSGSLIGY